MNNNSPQKSSAKTRKSDIQIHGNLFENAFSFHRPDSGSLIRPLDIFNACMNSSYELMQTSNPENNSHEFIAEMFSSENRTCIYAEFIFQAYLYSLLSSDASKELLLNNQSILKFLEETGRKSDFSNNKTLFLESYAIYENGVINKQSTYNVFQSGFYSFITNQNIIKSTETDADYCVPLHFVPVFSSIIAAWNYSPIMHTSQKLIPHRTLSKPSFTKFQKKVMDILSIFKTDSTFQLFTEYIICFFFGNTYISAFATEVPSHFYEYPPKEAIVYHNEVLKYDNILCDINNSVPYLALKKMLVQEATNIFKHNTEKMYKPSAELFTGDEKNNISKSIRCFIQLLQKETKNMESATKEFMNKNLQKIMNQDKKYIIQPCTEFYADSLQKIFNSYSEKINMLAKNLKEYFIYYSYFEHNTIKTIFDGTLPLTDSVTPMHNTENPDYDSADFKYIYESGQTSQRLKKFSRHICKLSEQVLKNHMEKLKKELLWNQESDAENYKQKLIHSSCTELKKISLFILTLEKRLNTRLPVQKIKRPEERPYEPLYFTIKTANMYYKYLFDSFYSELIYLAESTESIPLWQILHTCISDNAKVFRNSLRLT